MSPMALVPIVSFILLLGGCDQPEPESSIDDNPSKMDLAPSEDAQPADHLSGLAQWHSYGRDYSEQRFVPTSQINPKTVNRLGLSYAVDLNAYLGISATPLLVDGLLMFPTNWNIVVALDARSGEQVWQFDPEVPRETTRGMGGASSRGVASHEGKIILATMDGRLVAVTAKDGRKLWETNTLDGGTCTQAMGVCFISGAPRVAKGKVFIGFGGAENNARGYVSAYDVDTGAFLWRFFVVPGDRNDPDHPEHPEMAEAIKTWGESWNDYGYGGGGTVWDSIVYDPDVDQLLIGTGNGGPMFARHLRAPDGGDLLYLASIIALDPDTGRMKWYYQQVPGDQWDYTSTQAMMLADLEIGGNLRKVVMQAPKNGFFYVLDRRDGKLISAERFAKVTWAEKVDLATGRPIETPQSDYREKPKWVSPGGIGAANWQPSAYNPETGLAYISARESTFLFHLSEEFPDREAYPVRPGFSHNGLDKVNFPKLMEQAGPAPHDVATGYLKAFDPVKGELAWEVPLPHFWNGGVLTTAGDLVFMGNAMGQLDAFHARTGDRLWSFDTYRSIISSPISYELDGIQYVALLTGTGMASAAFGYNGPTASYLYGNRSQLLVFSLDAKAGLPEPEKIVRVIPKPPEQKGSAADVAEGDKLYHTYCSHCHGSALRSDSVMPDLRWSQPGIHTLFNQIVLDGIFVVKGMAGFSDVLNETQVEQIHSYVIKRIEEDYQQEQSEELEYRGGT